MTNQLPVTNPELTLKISPPRAPRHMLARARLNSDCERFRDRPVTIVQAPPGFGKTSLLIQWRHEFLMHGCSVAWLSLDVHDDPSRLLAGLTLAIRFASGRSGFGKRLTEGGALPDNTPPLAGITAWLAEVAHTALDIVLMLDEAEQLPQASQEALVYLLENLPANLRIVVASRGGFDKVIRQLTAYGQCATVDAAALRFRLEDTIALIGNRFGAEVDADASARLHDITEGWPLGLQLALAAIGDTQDPVASIDAFAGSTGGIREQFVTVLLERLSSDEADFLTRSSIVDLLHADLCVALTGVPDARQRLARLARETPLFFSAQERGDWFRLHSMAREALRARLAVLPSADQVELHSRAMRWLAEHGLTEAAARHALASGQEETAYELAHRCLHEAVTQGRLATVLEWLEWLPQPVLDRHPRLRLALAWALAMSDRHLQAEAQAQAILKRAEPDEAMRYEIDLILSAAAYFADEPDRAGRLMVGWGDTPPVNEPWLHQVHANRLAVRALLNGEYAKARRVPLHTSSEQASSALRYVARWRDYITGPGLSPRGANAARGTYAAPGAAAGRRRPRPAASVFVHDRGAFRRHPFQTR